MKIIFTVPGEPQGKARPRFDSIRKRTYTPMKTRRYENFIAGSYAAAGGRCFECAVAMRIKAYYGIPKSVSKKRRALLLANSEPVSRKPDIDNVVKAVLDGLNRFAYNDDKQVVALSAAKLYSDDPRLEIEISEV